VITAELEKLHQSNFKSLTKAGVDWYNIVKNNPKLLEKYLCYLKLKSEYIMVNIDFSQLELYVLASLSGDPDMIATVNSGRDLHDVNTEKVYGISKS
jgi:chromosome condensin MukBEF MukE localization factor